MWFTQYIIMLCILWVVFNGMDWIFSIYFFWLFIVCVCLCVCMLVSMCVCLFYVCVYMYLCLCLFGCTYHSTHVDNLKCQSLPSFVDYCICQVNLCLAFGYSLINTSHLRLVSLASHTLPTIPSLLWLPKMYTCAANVLLPESLLCMTFKKFSLAQLVVFVLGILVKTQSHFSGSIPSIIKKIVFIQKERTSN